MADEDRIQVPCLECGRECVDGEDTTAEVEVKLKTPRFGREYELRTVPAKVCPHCGTVNPL